MSPECSSGWICEGVMTGAPRLRATAVRACLLVSATIGVLAWSAARAAAQGAAPAPAAVEGCTTCHATGDVADAPNLAKLTGLSEAYLLKQLQDYRAGRRKSDIMGPMANGLKTSDLRPVAAHFAGLKPVPEKGTDAALAMLGKALYDNGNQTTGVPNCVGCHGPNGGDAPAYPRLAGQVATYTVQEMMAFKAGTRTNDRARIMREIASRMTEDEIKAVAAYAAGLPVGR